MLAEVIVVVVRRKTDEIRLSVLLVVVMAL